MGITSSSLHWDGAGGRRGDSGHEYTAVWRVITDDANEQAKTVLDWFQAHLVAYGDIYNYAADGPDPLSFAQDFNAERDKGGAFVWNVIVDFRPLQPGDDEDEDENPTNNPLEKAPEFIYRTVQYTKPTEWAEYRGGFVNTGTGGRPFIELFLPADKKTVPVNSASDPINPGLEQDDHRGVLIFRRNLRTIDIDNIQIQPNLVNKDQVDIDYRGVKKSCAPLTLKARDFFVSHQMRGDDGTAYRETELHMDWDPNTWVDSVPDLGLNSRKWDGDPDGKGDYVSASDREEGDPASARITDLYDYPIAEMVMLDGNGQPMKGDTSIKNPIYIEYLKYVGPPGVTDGDPIDFVPSNYLDPYFNRGNNVDL